MKIALVDDEVQHLTKLHELLASELLKLLPQSRHQIDSYSTSQAFLQRWEAGSYDVIILDIFMGGITGVDIAKEIRRTDPDVKLVFCSRSNEFAAESYQQILDDPSIDIVIITAAWEAHIDLAIAAMKAGKSE